ncbi:MAG TPA: argininosuccinate lyase [Actinomycetota bacterium]|nr:argininosuccinate lyase [Actinomycetota bacterium]
MGSPVEDLGAHEVTMLWGGRFERGPHPEMVAFTRSVDVDLRLLPYDIAATKAHARVLVAAGLLEDSDLPALDAALDDISSAWGSGTLEPAPEDEDVHSLVERLLTERLGDLGRRIHAGRSRNDLVATDLRLWCRDAAAEMVDALTELVGFLCDFAEGQLETVMPGFTHLQRAQPVSMGFHIVAHACALVRDIDRFKAAFASSDVSPLGAGALAGNTLGLDPTVAATELNFGATFVNATDAVADRDFAADLLYACATTMTHLSRVAEEVVLWTSSEFGFARIADDWSTGSSMMPQKRNPDVAELIRGRAPGVVADLGALLGILKGLPLAYDRDLQEDKEVVFHGFDTTIGCVRATRGLLGALRFDKDALTEAARGGGGWATDLAERLVTRGVPFREAHETIGGIVASLERSAVSIADADLAGADPRLKPDDAVDVADPRTLVARRASHGGPAPSEVERQIRTLRSAIARLPRTD